MNLYVVVMCEAYLRTRETLQEGEDRAAVVAADAKRVRAATNRKNLLASGKEILPSLGERAAAHFASFGAHVSSLIEWLRAKMPGLPPLKRLVEAKHSISVCRFFCLIAQASSSSPDVIPHARQTPQAAATWRYGLQPTTVSKEIIPRVPLVNGHT